MRGSLAVSLVGSILITACSVAPKWQGRDPVLSRLPVSKNVFLAAANLIEIHEVDPTISIDLRYTRESAIARRPLYPPNMKAFLRPETAVRLRRANDELKGYGYRIQVWDAYRPPAAQLILWEASGFDDRFFRMWEYYLAYCEGGFREQCIGVYQLVFRKPGARTQFNRFGETLQGEMK